MSLTLHCVTLALTHRRGVHTELLCSLGLPHSKSMLLQCYLILTLSPVGIQHHDQGKNILWP